MTPNPILKVLSTLKKHCVKYLLIGGQACIIYGAAEFSRDSDLAVLGTPKNLELLKDALAALKAELIYVPPLEVEYLQRGHACHFRCTAGDVRGLRVDVISKLRGCETFVKLWKRRKIVKPRNGRTIDVIGLRDLVKSKKTQRDKDWLMLKRLVNNDIGLNKYEQREEHVKWWLQECRDADILSELAEKFPKIIKDCIAGRPLLSSVISSDTYKLNAQLREEERRERQEDREYWMPLRKELEMLRHRRK